MPDGRIGLVEEDMSDVAAGRVLLEVKPLFTENLVDLPAAV